MATTTDPHHPDPDSNPSVISPTEFIHGTFKGEPAITIPHRIEESMAAKFQTTLVGKFSQGKPGMDSIRRFISLQNFKGTVLVGLIDRKHVLLRFEITEDYIRLFSRSIWNVEGKPMRILKWTSNFRIDRESSIIPIWLSLPMLPIHLVNEDFIFSLVSSFCKPLRIDSATELLKRPSVSRVQVEFDILDILPSRVWVQSENGKGFWQVIEIDEALPFYCTYCWHIGHHEQICTLKHPELLLSAHKTDRGTHKEYRPKHQQPNTEKDQPFNTEKDQQVRAETDQQISAKTNQQGSAPIASITPTQQVHEQRGQQQKIDTIQVEKEENWQQQAIDINSATGPKQPRREEEMIQEQNFNNTTPMEKNSGPMICKAHPSISSKRQTSKSFKASSPIVSSYKGKENDYEDGMATKSISAAHSYGKITGSSETLITRNHFDMLSELDTMHSPQLSVDDIQTELQFLNLDGPNVRRTGYTSEKDSKVKLTPAQRIRRTRKKTKIFDL